MDFDDILKVIGEFGTYQRKKYFLVCLVAIACSSQCYITLFTTYTPKHRCSLPPDVFNGTDTWQNQSAAHSALVDQYIPVDKSGNMDSCHIYSSHYKHVTNRTEMKCSSWVYDTSQRDYTYVSRLNLVCGKELTATTLVSMYMFGNLVGSITSGLFSDMLGRKISLLVAVGLMFLSGVVLSFVVEVYTIAVFRLLTGLASQQMFLSAFVIGVEIVGPKYRLITGIVIEVFFACGFLILVGVAYAIRCDTYLHLVLTLPIVCYSSYYWLLPESARWLISRGRVQEAKEILHQIAATNGTKLPNDLDIDSGMNVVKQSNNIAGVLRSPRLMCRSLILFVNWIVISLAYLGLSLGSDDLPGSLYVNTALSAAAELVGYLLCFVCLVAGRKWPHVVSMSVGGLACLSSVLVYYYADGSTKKWAFIALNQVGKVGVTTGFAIIYIWSAELFPTVVRTSMIGVSSMLSRIGSISAPYVADIGDFVSPQLAHTLPSLIFGVLTLAGGLLSIGLPETTGYDLPETIAEAEVFPRQLEEVVDNGGESQENEEPNNVDGDLRTLIST